MASAVASLRSSFGSLLSNPPRSFLFDSFRMPPHPGGDESVFVCSCFNTVIFLPATFERKAGVCWWRSSFREVGRGLIIRRFRHLRNKSRPLLIHDRFQFQCFRINFHIFYSFSSPGINNMHHSVFRLYNGWIRILTDG